MKRITAILLVMLAGFFTADRLQAQSREVRATIPFNFIVGGKQLPAGTYKIFPNNEATIVIQNRNQPITILSMVQKKNYGVPVNVGRLTFNKYGDRYFLSEIHSTASSLNVVIPRSKLEKRTETQQASVESSQVLIAAE
jgi:hypothetical protein